MGGLREKQECVRLLKFDSRERRVRTRKNPKTPHFSFRDTVVKKDRKEERKPQYLYPQTDLLEDTPLRRILQISRTGFRFSPSLPPNKQTMHHRAS
jgi:hypothetical protein